jgi:LPS-assembly protein
VAFLRQEGVSHERVDFTPSLSTDTLQLGHMVGFTPTVRLRETYWTRSVGAAGVNSAEGTHREIFWLGMEGNTRLSRRFGLGEGRSLLHTVEPSVVYEYVPGTRAINNIQVDEIDFLPKKNLVTYMLKSRLLEHGGGGASNNWLDLTIAQSYHVGAPPTSTFAFIQADQPGYNTFVQPLQFQLTPVESRKFSDIWTRAVFGNPVGFAPGRREVKLTVDTFIDPYRGQFSQFNSDVRIQDNNNWYIEVGQRWTNSGNRPRRGDIWNPISFNQVFAPTPEINFATVQGGMHLPYGWTVGARSYYDLKNGSSPETDFVALYQNPCKCWSLGLYYLKFPDRSNYNFMISLTGLGATDSFGRQVVQYILSPILYGEKAVPWPTPYIRPQPAQPAPASPPPGGMQP